MRAAFERARRDDSGDVYVDRICMKIGHDISEILQDTECGAAGANPFRFKIRVARLKRLNEVFRKIYRS